MTPPQDTRARARSAVMRALTGQKSRYVIDWDSIYVEDEKYLNLDDPFMTYDVEVEEFVAECRRPPAPPDGETPLLDSSDGTDSKQL